MSPIVSLNITHVNELGILNQQLLEDEGNHKSLSYDYLCQRMSRWLKNRDYFGFGYIYQNQLVAYLLACHEDEYCYIRQLVTDREHRRQGYASKLLNYIENHLGTNQQLRLDVLISNKNAMCFYAKRGYNPFYMAMIKTTSP
ncbi:MAG: hypothetical protein CENE_03190 [Candidatus Celerinatantimonas neptuna]|nr:MAG: hypothetical protein CENE_03190 [Candidatus Celerinatantimonas neptuna]